ncbi:MAG TPA: ABC transporter substrate-binding protein [Virgibacillus sp.]|nr:ABC transporter substrate-binding protein [Virgibacillus sp.]
MKQKRLCKVFTIFSFFMAIFLLSGCAVDSEPNNDNSTDSSGEAEDGGTLKVGLSANPNTLDPIAYTGIYESQIMRSIGDTLLVYNEDQSDFTPALATDWDISEDMKSYTFTLRDDVQFQPGEYQDGREMTAEDVKYSLERSAEDSAMNRLTGVDHVEVTDDNEVTIHLEEPNAALLAMLTDPGNIIIPEEEVEGWGDEFGAHLVGTGPFTLEDWKTDQQVDLKKNGDYWGDSPHLDGVSYRIISDPTMMTNSVRSGDIDIATDIKGQNREIIEKDDDLELLTTPALSTTYLDLNNEKGPTSDPKVREAIYKATDVEELVEGANQYGGASVSYSPIPQESWGYSDELEEYKPEYDPEEAKQILEETDYADGFETEIYVGESRVETATIFQNQMKENLDIDVEIKTAEWGTLSDTVSNGEAPMNIGGWTWYPDPYFFLNQTFHSDQIGSLGNGRGYDNPDVDKLLDKAQEDTVDQDERKELYQEANKLIMEDYTRIEIDNQESTAAITPEVNGFDVAPDMSINIVDPNGTNVWLDN